MFADRSFWGHSVALLAAVLALASCDVARDGPTAGEIFEGSVLRSGEAHIIAVNRAVAQVANRPDSLGFSHNLQAGALLNTDTIRAGDIVSVNVFENVPEGLIAPDTARNAVIADLQVDNQGNIFVPYAGTVRAAGKSPAQLREELTAALDQQTPEPQVIVIRAPGDAAQVSVAGGVNAQGVYPIDRGTQRLSGMIARAGGVSIPLETAQVLVTRGSRQDAAWLQDIYSHPQLDIALRAGDRILVKQDQRAFAVLGATGTRSRMTFDTQTISAIEALAMAGGLDPLRADPKGVFIFRDELPEVASAILGGTPVVGDQRFVYVLDLTRPMGMFEARDFKIRDGDTIFVTEASSVLWARQIAALTGSLATATAVRAAAGGGSE